jgi:hypothetical protein
MPHALVAAMILAVAMASDNKRLQHFKEIARCPVMIECLSSRESASPCAPIVNWQWNHLENLDLDARRKHWKTWHQLPEPWVGHLDKARILFVSSNPSIGGEVPPDFATAEPPKRVTARRSDDAIIHRFEWAFDDYMTDGVRHLGEKKAVRYWVSVKRRAEELLPEGDLRPGWDYALTEVVRCKSRSEKGVASAVEQCVPLYLKRTLELSPAVVIVALGAHARRALGCTFHTDATVGVVAQINVGGTDRLLTFLPHPNARGAPKSFAKNHTPARLRQLQSRLKEQAAQQ